LKKHITKQVMVGGVAIGGGAPVSIQSMLSAPARDIAANVAQAKELKEAGCDILRVAIPDRESVALIPAIKEKVDIPLVADIHFDYRLALEAVAAGADKIRLNPGNIGGEDKVRQVAKACRQHNIPIRVGVNSGSVEKDLLERYGRTPQALAESALRHVDMLERCDFTDIVIAIKSSDAAETVAANRLLAKQTIYPLHLGVTEAGTPTMGILKSAAALGSLLLDGIGDTIRISLTAPPVEEVKVAQNLLKALGLRGGVRIISCPTCGRCNIPLMELAARVEEALSGLEGDLTVAVMGCAVNGPGEASHADIGVAGGRGEGPLFAKGKPVKKVPYDEILPHLVKLAQEALKQA